jgi:hypothetical protein
MKLLNLFFGGYKLVSKNDLNALYGQIHASSSRLQKIKVSNVSKTHAIEKTEILTILESSAAIIDRYT